MPGWSCSPSGQKAPGCQPGKVSTVSTGWGFAEITTLQGNCSWCHLAEIAKWPWFASPCGQMKLLVRTSTWHSAFATILPFQRADRVPFKIQAACWWTLQMHKNLHFQWKMKMPESPFYQVLNKNKFIFFMPIIICLEGARAALRMRREDAWASCANGEGLWLDREGEEQCQGQQKLMIPDKTCSAFSFPEFSLIAQ